MIDKKRMREMIEKEEKEKKEERSGSEDFLLAKIILFIAIGLILAYAIFIMWSMNELQLGEKCIYALSIMGFIYIIEKILEKIGVI